MGAAIAGGGVDKVRLSGNNKVRLSGNNKKPEGGIKTVLSPITGYLYVL